MNRSRFLGLGIALALADSSVVTLALPDIIKRFHLEIAEVAWVLTLYNLGLALAAVPAAYAARGRPVLAFGAGTVVFAAASLVCGFAPGYGWLLAGRGIQAVGGALLICAALERAAAGFQRNLKAHGANAVGTFSCSKSTNEVNFLAQKLARVAFGTNNIDSCNRT